MLRLILAQVAISRVDRLKHMQDRFADPEPGAAWNMFWVGIMLAGTFAVAWFLWWLERRRSEPSRPQPRAIFVRMLKKLGLPLADRWRMGWMAHVLKTPHPTALLISEQLFDEAVRRYRASPGLFGSRARAGSRIAAIRPRLFDAADT